MSVLQCANLHGYLLPAGRIPSAHLPWSMTDLPSHRSFPVESALVAFKCSTHAHSCGKYFQEHQGKQDHIEQRLKFHPYQEQRLGLTLHTQNKDVLTMWWPGGLPVQSIQATNCPISPPPLSEHWLNLDNQPSSPVFSAEVWLQAGGQDPFP